MKPTKWTALGMLVGALVFFIVRHHGSEEYHLIMDPVYTNSWTNGMFIGNKINTNGNDFVFYNQIFTTNKTISKPNKP